MRKAHRNGTGRAALALACAVLLASAAAAERPDRRGPPGAFAARHAERLGLDAETQAEIQAVVEQSGERDAALRERLDQARHAMFDLMHDTPQPDEAAVLAQADAIGDVEAEIHKNRLRGILEIRRLMTPEQLEALVQLREEEAPHRSHRRRGLRACGEDVRELCPGAASGRAALVCMNERWDALSDRCRGAFDFESPRPQGPR